MMKRGLGLSSPLAALALAACTSPGGSPPPAGAPPSPTASAPSPPDSACAEAASLRARVPGLRQKGKLDRALRVLEKADRLCAASAGESSAARAEILADLAAPSPDGETLVQAGLAARAHGDAAEAQKLFDRGLAALALSLGRPVELAVKNGLAGGAPLAFSPDGKLLAIGDEGDLLVQKAAGRELFRYFPGEVRAAVFLDDRTLLAGGPSGARRLDLRTGAVLGEYPTAEPVTAVAVSRDQKQIALGLARGSILIWDLAAPKPISTLAGHIDTVNGLAFSKDGKRLFSCAADGVPGSVRAHRLGAGAGKDVIFASPPGLAPENHQGCNALAVAADDKVVAGNCLFNATCLWSGDTGKLLRVLPPFEGKNNPEATSVAFSPDGARVATGSSEGDVRIAAVKTGKIEREAHLGGPALAIAYSPSGGELVAGGRGRVSFLRESDAAIVESPPARYEVPIRAIALGRTAHDVVAMATGGVEGNEVLLLSPGEPSGGASLLSLGKGAGLPGPLLFSPDGARIAHCGRFAHHCDLWETANGHSIASFGDQALANAIVIGAGFWPDARSFTVAAANRTLRQFDAASGTLQKEYALDAASQRKQLTHGAAFSPDGQTVGYCGDLDNIALWEPASGHEPRVLAPTGAAECSLGFSPDGRRVAAGLPHAAGARIWDVASGAPVANLDKPLAGASFLAFSPDGKTLLTAPREGKSASLWDSASGARLAELASPGTPITAVAFSASGKLAAVSSDNDAVLLYSLPEGRLAATLRVTGKGPEMVAFAPGGSIEFLGGRGAAVPICHLGAVAFPFEVCEERFLAPGLTASIFAGERGYLEP